MSSRVDRLLADSNEIIDHAIDFHFTATGHEHVASVGLYSGGNDSTTLVHAFRSRLDYVAHCNTGIGIEQTRQFVRDTALGWGIPLLEVHPQPGDTYRDLILDQGFPGPGHHFKMYQRLKERGLRQVRGMLVQNPRKQRVLFLAGRRRDESARRAALTAIDRQGSIVFVSPLVHWTKQDLNAYRRDYPDIPRNEVSDLLHMSGECLCGSFAHPGELEEIRFWFPDVAAEIDTLGEEIRAAGLPEKKCVWGWGAGSGVKASKVGALCSSCDARFLGDNHEATHA